MNRYAAGHIYPLLMYRKLYDVSRYFISGTYIACMIIHKIRDPHPRLSVGGGMVREYQVLDLI
jgi:hypothetical protein